MDQPFRLPKEVGCVSFKQCGSVGAWISAKAEEGQFGTPKGAEGTRIFKATEHPFYSGEFHLKGNRTTLKSGLLTPYKRQYLSVLGSFA